MIILIKKQKKIIIIYQKVQEPKKNSTSLRTVSRNKVNKLTLLT